MPLFKKLILFISLAATGASAESWIKLDPLGPVPSGRTDHVQVYDPNSNSVIVFGGAGAPPDSSVWVLTHANGLGGTPAWTQLSTSGTPPTPRAGVRGAYDSVSNRLIIHGGYVLGAGTMLNDTWVLTNANGLGGTPQWIQLSTAGATPLIRIGMSVHYDSSNNILMVATGCSSSSAFACFNNKNDVWLLSNANGLGGAPSWTQLTPTGVPPPPRALAGSAYDVATNRLIITGGVTNVDHFSDLWILTSANGLGGASQWIQQFPSISAPDHYNVATAYVPLTNRFFVARGVIGSSLSSAVYRLDNANGTSTPSWSQRFPSGTLPPPIDAPKGVLDNTGIRLITYGGSDSAGQFPQDVWVLVLEDQTDTTQPAITPTVTPPPNSVGWNNTNPTVSWSVTDAESGIASSSGCGTVTFTTETTATVVTCSATNGAGITASASVTVKLDKTPPTVSITTPANGSSYILGASITASYSCSDPLSGVATCAGPVASGSSFTPAAVGANQTFTVQGTDVAGNTASASVNYDVTYSFLGFLPPIDNLPIINSVRAGATVPIKWQLKNNAGGFISDLAAVTSIQSSPIACDASPVTFVGDETQASGATVLRYDSAANQFIYNWATDRTWTGCRLLQVSLNDGSARFAKFQFR